MSRWRPWASLCAAVLGLASLLVGAETVSAHTDFESSSPAQGDVVAEPVSSVVLVFSADTQPVGDLVVALDASGTLQNPTEVTTDDQRTFIATFDPALAGGDIGIRWTVLGADGHPLEGAFSFNVTAPAPTTTPTPPATTEPTEPAPASTASAEREEEANEGATEVADDSATDDSGATDATDDTDAANAGAVPTTSELLVAADGGTAPVATDPAAAPTSDGEVQSLDDFLAVDSTLPGDGRRLAGRLLSIPATAGAIGALAFLAFALRGSAREISVVVSAVRIAGVVVAAGAVVHYLGSIAATGESFATGWTGTPGASMAIRLVGAIALVAGLRATTTGRAANDRVGRSLSAAVVGDVVADSRAPMQVARDRQRWDPSSSKPALSGVAILVASFWFDGHTVTTGWRPLHAVVNSVHVVAGSIWLGGVITLAAVAWWRYRAGTDARLGELVVRFSSIATIALAAVAVAGGVLAIFVLDGFGELTGTEWGRTLLLKTGGVGLAASLGAYNHFRLRPALVARPDDLALRATLRSVLTAEAILLAFVAIVTCWLVAAAT